MEIKVELTRVFNGPSRPAGMVRVTDVKTGYSRIMHKSHMPMAADLVDGESVTYDVPNIKNIYEL